MAADRIAKTSKWFSNKSLRLSLQRHRSKSSNPSSPSSPLTPKRNAKEAELREVFRYFDSDGDGKISALEIRAYFGSIGEYISHEAAQRVIKDIDTDGDDLLDLDDFERLMKRDEGDEGLRRAFQMFEVEKESGCITPQGLQRMLDRLGTHKSYDECIAMIRVFDIDGNGTLDYNEFQQMMA